MSSSLEGDYWSRTQHRVMGLSLSNQISARFPILGSRASAWRVRGASEQFRDRRLLEVLTFSGVGFLEAGLKIPAPLLPVIGTPPAYVRAKIQF